MDKLPLFGAFVDGIMSRVNEVKQAVYSKRWGFLTLYLFVCAVILATGVAGVIALMGGARATLVEWFPAKAVSYAPKTLTYNRITKNEKNEEGLYRNLFELFIISPAGNSVPYAFIDKRFAQDVECVYGSETAQIELGVGLATTSKRLLADCLTKEPVIDSGKLFGIVDVNELPEEEIPLPPPSQ